MQSMPHVTFRRWLNGADRKERRVYHVGHLAQDRWIISFEPGDGSISEYQDPELQMLADTVYAAYQAGKVYLLQRKIGENTYEYIAERR